MLTDSTESNSQRFLLSWGGNATAIIKLQRQADKCGKMQWQKLEGIQCNKASVLIYVQGLRHLIFSLSNSIEWNFGWITKSN